ncbi:hypothetical protein L596_005877 [Steinernema carpocapsae]|uniref:Uncharacterized protein n=1 Tax=Steinernema carpocapsae TaxID=34508 RepID=A0A4U8V1P5_STECR|nr:hypothetical protein L596_005877 [Steinernema carpocapsae]
MLETMSATNEVMTNVATGWLDGFGMPPGQKGYCGHRSGDEYRKQQQQKLALKKLSSVAIKLSPRLLSPAAAS